MVSKGTAASTKRVERRQKLFPSCHSEVFETAMGGFAQIPRVVPMLASLVNEVGGKENAGSLYQVLWSHDWGQGLIEVKNPRALLFEAGYTGTTGRADRTWKERITILKNLGLIQTKQSGIEEFAYILLVNPYLAITRLISSPPRDTEPRKKTWMQDTWLPAFENLVVEYNVDLDFVRKLADSKSSS